MTQQASSEEGVKSAKKKKREDRSAKGKCKEGGRGYQLVHSSRTLLSKIVAMEPVERGSVSGSVSEEGSRE